MKFVFRFLAAFCSFALLSGFFQRAPAQEGLPALPPPPVAGGLFPGAEGEVLPAPACFNILNRAPYAVYGSINTSLYTTKDGGKASHRQNFRLKTGESVQACTSGPFYAGRKVHLVIRTLVPVFSCKTGIAGDVVIYGKKKAGGGTETWAGCL